MKNKTQLYILLFFISTLAIFLPLLFKDFFVHFKSLGLLGIFFINFFSGATILIPTPGILSVGVGGALYNPILVALAASLGSSLGDGIGFLFGLSSKEILNLKQYRFVLHFEKIIFSKISGTLLIFLFSFIPNPFFDGIGLLAGMSSYSLTKFVSIVFAGRLLRNLIIAYIGSTL